MIKKIFAIVTITLCFAASAAEPVSVYFPYAAGSTTDIVTRKMSEKLSNSGHNFTVIPAAGAAGLVAINAVINAQNTAIAVVGNGLLTFKDIDIINDIRPVAFIGYEPTVIAVRSESSVRSLKDLYEVAKTRQVFYGSSGVGSYGHYSSSIVANKNKNIVHVPFRSTGQALPELLAGRLDFLVMDETLIDRYVKSGQLMPIATNYSRRLTKYPDVPTFKEQGVDNLNFYRWELVVAKPNVDPKVVEKIQNYFSDPAVRNELRSMNMVSESVELSSFISTQLRITDRIKRDFVQD